MGPYRLLQVVRSQVGVFGLFCPQAVADATAGQAMPGDGCSNVNCLCGAENEGDLRVFPLWDPTDREEDSFWAGQVSMAQEAVS
jgi:hypothetical protein